MVNIEYLSVGDTVIIEAECHGGGSIPKSSYAIYFSEDVFAKITKVFKKDGEVELKIKGLSPKIIYGVGCLKY